MHAIHMFGEIIRNNLPRGHHPPSVCERRTNLPDVGENVSSHPHSRLSQGRITVGGQYLHPWVK